MWSALSLILALHTQKAKPFTALVGGHAFLAKPRHLCTKQVRCAGAVQTPGAWARSSGWAGGIVLKVFPPVLGFNPVSSGL